MRVHVQCVRDLALHVQGAVRQHPEEGGPVVPGSHAEDHTSTLTGHSLPVAGRSPLGMVASWGAGSCLGRLRGEVLYSCPFGDCSADVGRF